MADARTSPLTFREAEILGTLLHDRWEKMTGKAPLERSDMAWADIVQFVVRKAGDLASEREDAARRNGPPA
jgi:hypothetical protein